MTVSSTTNKVTYSGNGSTTAFAAPFYFILSSDLKVVLRSAAGIETVKTLTTDYTVTGAGSSSGGTVTMLTAPAAGTTLVIQRNVPLTQEVDYQANDPFPAATHEQALDKLTMETQQIAEAVSRSIKISTSNTMTSTEFTVDATSRAHKVLGFDGAGELSVAQELGTYRSTWSSGTAYVQRDLVKDASNNNVYICLTAHTASGSTPISSNADVAKWGLLVDAAASASSASSASSSASSAGTSASDASTSNASAAASASAAAASAATAATQASNAATSATNAAASATAATTNGAAQVTLAAAQVALATTQATNAASSATAAAASATAAAASAASINPSAFVSTSRAITAGTGLTGGGDLSADRTLSLSSTGVTAGAYTNSNITIDAQGRVTAAANGTGGGGGGGATGGGSDAIFYNNGQTITTNYTIPTGQNAGSFGPVSVNSGITVTVPSGSTWSII